MLESGHTRKPGRPTPKDDLLMSRRDRLVWLLSVAWGDIGWELPKAASREQLHEALAALGGHPSEDAISIFVRRTSASTTAQELRNLRKELEKTVDRMHAAYQKQRTCADSLREADAAIKVNRVEDANTELMLDPRLDEKQRNAMVSEF